MALWVWGSGAGPEGGWGSQAGRRRRWGEGWADGAGAGEGGAPRAARRSGEGVGLDQLHHRGKDLPHQAGGAWWGGRTRRWGNGCVGKAVWGRQTSGRALPFPVASVPGGGGESRLSLDAGHAGGVGVRPVLEGAHHPHRGASRTLYHFRNEGVPSKPWAFLGLKPGDTVAAHGRNPAASRKTTQNNKHKSNITHILVTKNPGTVKLFMSLHFASLGGKHIINENIPAEHFF